MEMFLNQVNFMWRDLGHATGRRAAALVLAPLVVFLALALPAILRATPVVAEHVELSGTGSSTGPEVHLRDSYQVTVTVTGQAGCVSDVMIGGRYGFTPEPFPSDATASQTRVSKADITGIEDGMYRVAMTATQCGPWTVTLDRAQGTQ
jgi:hypothetical protein